MLVDSFYQTRSSPSEREENNDGDEEIEVYFSDSNGENAPVILQSPAPAKKSGSNGANKSSRNATKEASTHLVHHQFFLEKFNRERTRRRHTHRIIGSFAFLLMVCAIVFITLGRNEKSNSWFSSKEGESNKDKSPDNENSNGSSSSNNNQGINPNGTETNDAPSGETFILTGIVSHKPIYQHGEEIHISFLFGYDADPNPDDWIGLYPYSENLHILLEPVMFLYTCNKLFACDKMLTQGTVVFQDNAEDSVWPLPAGEYKAFLLRNTEQPYTVIAQSQTITVLPHPVEMIAAAESDIRDLITADPALGPKFVRLGFHDCVGGCDGCVDMTFDDNAGLETPLEALADIVTKHELPTVGFSRADIWALSALVGADVAQERSEYKVDFAMKWYGRQNCEARGPCLEADGTTKRDCRFDLGPHRELPHETISSADLLHFFSHEFGFSDKETVALMGAHTLGSLSRSNSGFDGENGWARDNLLLDNDYFKELVGRRGETPLENTTLQELIELAPPWEREFINNNDLEGIPNRRAWTASPRSNDFPDGERILMLNADIALVRELDETNIGDNGFIGCVFTTALSVQSSQSVPRCPHAAKSLGFAADYRFNNTLWMDDFQLVYQKMLVNGYNNNIDGECESEVCTLTQTPAPTNIPTEAPSNAPSDMPSREPTTLNEALSGTQAPTYNLGASESSAVARLRNFFSCLGVAATLALILY